MNAIALTIGDRNLASTHYRLGQFVDLLASRDISLTLAEVDGFSDWSSLRRYDLVILQKRLLRIPRVRRIRREAKCLVFDTDDAIWEPYGRAHSWWTRVRTNQRLRAITAVADACTVSNQYLARTLRPLARQVHLIPMALDENQWKPRSQRLPGPIRLGWSGAPANLPYLVELGKALEAVQSLRPTVELIVYCGEAPAWKDRVQFRHHVYSPGTEPAVVNTFDIGLLPLPDNAFAVGKSPIKALQYAACGVPCVASPVGATKEIVRDLKTGLLARERDAWREALIRLVDDEALRRRLGDEARRTFLAHHSQAQVLDSLVSIWRQVVASRRQ